MLWAHMAMITIWVGGVKGPWVPSCPDVSGQRGACHNAGGRDLITRLGGTLQKIGRVEYNRLSLARVPQPCIAMMLFRRSPQGLTSLNEADIEHEP